MAGGSWTLDLAPIREFAERNFLVREIQRGDWTIAPIHDHSATKKEHRE